jgi:pimeloyl-ACP methyl ester carboxylesterase
VPLASVDNIEINYETHGPSDGVPLLLIMGLGNQLTTWPWEFCQGLVDREFLVIRFDHRDTGLSTRLDDLEYDISDDVARLLAGEPSLAPYSLEDMAADSLGVLDHLGLERVHLLGQSMGGMIAQAVVIENRSRVMSLTSMSSSTGSHDVGQPSKEALQALLEPAAVGREAKIEQNVRSRRIWASPEHFDEEFTRQHFEQAWERGGDSSAGSARHAGAVISAADREPRLAQLDVPTLVIHGDKDALVDPSGGLRTAEVIPDAQLLMLEGMGHDFPAPYWAQIIESVTTLAARAASVE